VTAAAADGERQEWKRRLAIRDRRTGDATRR
jgi:hypothetical protein